jgi:hypothetical protein
MPHLMTAVSAPLTAAERTQAAYQQTVQHRRNVALARSRRERARNVRLALISSAILVAGLVFGFSYGLPIWLTAPRAAAKVFKPIDPFVASRVGQIRVPFKGDICRQVEFDNSTGRFRGESLVVCDGVVQGPGGASSPEARSRLDSLRNAFKR